MSPYPPIYNQPFRLATRGSPLALAQAHLAELTLSQPGFSCELVPLSSHGDQHPHIPLSSLAQHEPAGAKGSFIRTLEQSLLCDDSPTDGAVHSLKDLPAADSSPLSVACYLPRHYPFDVCLIKKHRLPPHTAINSLQELQSLAQHTRICLATSSLRRQAFIKATLPEIDLKPIRGNIDTRLNKVLNSTTVDGLVIAGAGIIRLKRVLESQLNHFCILMLPPDSFVPSAGQGGVVIQMLTSHPYYSTVKTLSCCQTALCCTIERMLVAALGAHCLTPLGCFVSITQPQDARHHHHTLTVSVCLSSTCGLDTAKTRLHFNLDTNSYFDANYQSKLKATIKHQVLEHLIHQGAGKIMADLGLNFNPNHLDHLTTEPPHAST